MLDFQQLFSRTNLLKMISSNNIQKTNVLEGISFNINGAPIQK